MDEADGWMVKEKEDRGDVSFDAIEDFKLKLCEKYSLESSPVT